MIVDRDGGRSPGELRGEKAVGRVEAPLIHLGPWEPRRLRRREGRRLATEAPAFLAPVVAEVVVERVDVDAQFPPVGRHVTPRDPCRPTFSLLSHPPT